MYLCLLVIVAGVLLVWQYFASAVAFPSAGVVCLSGVVILILVGCLARYAWLLRVESSHVAEIEAELKALREQSPERETQIESLRARERELEGALNKFTSTVANVPTLFYVCDGVESGRVLACSNLTAQVALDDSEASANALIGKNSAELATSNVVLPRVTRSCAVGKATCKYECSGGEFLGLSVETVAKADDGSNLYIYAGLQPSSEVTVLPAVQSEVEGRAKQLDSDALLHCLLAMKSTDDEDVFSTLLRSLSVSLHSEACAAIPLKLDPLERMEYCSQQATTQQILLDAIGEGADFAKMWPSQSSYDCHTRAMSGGSGTGSTCELPCRKIAVADSQYEAYACPVYAGSILWGSVVALHPATEVPLAYSLAQRQLLAFISILYGLAVARQESRFEASVALDKAHNDLRAQSLFFASTVHELRTPLSIVMGYSDLIQSGVSDVAKIREYCSHMSGATKSIKELVDNTLDLSKLEAGQMAFKYSPAKVQELCCEVFRQFDAQMKAKNIRPVLRCSVLPLLFIDSLRIKQIIVNLVSNAIKFTPSGSIIIRVKYVGVVTNRGDSSTSNSAVTGEPPAAGTGTLAISVIDTGIGIQPEEQERLFNPYAQSASQTGTEVAGKGTGLGLSVCMLLAKRMHGDISVSSIPGRGTRFTVTLNNVKYAEDATVTSQPLTPRSGQSGDSSFGDFSGNELSGINMLIVDDRTEMLTLLSTILGQRLGASVSCATSAEAALDLAKRSRFSIVVCDLDLGGQMDGSQLAEVLRKEPNCASAAFACLTGASSGAFDARQFDSVIIKGTDNKQIMRTVLDLFRKSQGKA